MNFSQPSIQPITLDTASIHPASIQPIDTNLSIISHYMSLSCSCKLHTKFINGLTKKTNRKNKSFGKKMLIKDSTIKDYTINKLKNGKKYLKTLKLRGN